MMHMNSGSDSAFVSSVMMNSLADAARAARPHAFDAGRQLAALGSPGFRSLAFHAQLGLLRFAHRPADRPFLAHNEFTQARRRVAAGLPRGV